MEGTGLEIEVLPAEVEVAARALSAVDRAASAEAVLAPAAVGDHLVSAARGAGEHAAEEGVAKPSNGVGENDHEITSLEIQLTDCALCPL